MFPRWWLRTGRPRREDAWKVLVLILWSVGVALLAVGGFSGGGEALQVGDVAPRTVKATRSFRYLDTLDHEERREAARSAVLAVYRHDRSAYGAQVQAARRAFADAREDWADGAEAEAAARQSAREDVRRVFRDRLGLTVPDSDIDVLMDAGFPDAALGVVEAQLLTLTDRWIIGDRVDLPATGAGFVVVGAAGVDQEVREPGQVLVPEEARRELEIRASMEARAEPWYPAASRLARALVRTNLAADPVDTLARQEAAANLVPVPEVYVQRGTVLFRDGEVLTASQILRYQASSQPAGPTLGLRAAAVALFLAALVALVVQFAATNLPNFSLSLRDVTAAAAVLMLIAVLGRVIVGVSDPVATLLGADVDPQSLWFLVPVAGAAVLTRLLLGVGWSLVTAVVGAAVFGVLMDLDALMALFALVSSVVAAGAVDHTRERLAVLRAGLVTGGVNAVLAALVHLLAAFAADGDVVTPWLSLRLLGSVAFAFAGGVASSFLVLGLLPVFELWGFVTDYRMMELANLNHPLMRQLMLRAPGSYHHSVVVGSLAEAGCEAIAANALQTRVAAYFHDIGKSLKPQYFVENQGSGGNKHVGLDPYTSAAILVSHVTEGLELARRHRLPKPILDNIQMHHGTGLIQYFYTRAVADADGDPARVDEAAFRYPGPKPDSKESGILMLADKVEAATRTIAEPTEEKFRSMIHAIINSVMADGQFERCPLTFQELYSITDAFVGVLLGIHHQRIEYPQTAHLSGARRDIPPPPRRGEEFITLEIPSQSVMRTKSPTPVPVRRGDEGAPEAEPRAGDYEAVEHLPTGEGR